MVPFQKPLHGFKNVGSLNAMNVGLLGLSYSLAEELLMGEICVMLHVMWEARYIVPTPSIIE